MKRNETFHLALITGATSGLGEGLARLLASKGTPLILSGRNEEVLLKLKKELNVPVEIVVSDLAKSRESLVKIIKEKVPDLIINNAGFGYYGDALTYKTIDQLELLEVNGKALLELTLEGARALISRGKKGVIMNISSTAGYKPMPLMSVYSASKAFVTNLSESLYEELKPYGIEVLVSCPGVIDTNFSSRASHKTVKKIIPFAMTKDYAVNKIWDQIVKRNPVCIFDWKYWILVRLGQIFFPNRLSSKILKKFVDSSYKSTPIIKNE